jgi:hypothetical protein
LTAAPGLKGTPQPLAVRSAIHTSLSGVSASTPPGRLELKYRRSP